MCKLKAFTLQHTLEQDGKFSLRNTVSVGAITDVNISVQFQIHICDHISQHGKSHFLAQGELLVVWFSSPYLLGGWDVEFLYF